MAKNFKQDTDKQSLLTQLRIAGYQIPLPLQLSLTEDTVLICHQILRLVPKKRIVCKGSYAGKTVLIKLFIHKKRAKIHWKREYAGATLLQKKHILTPRILLATQTKEDIYVLVFPFIEGNNIATLWQTAKNKQREQLLFKMLNVLVSHHKAGIVHQDLHYANFLQAEDGNIYTLDGEEAIYKKKLSSKKAFSNLALLLAQSFTVDRDMSEKLLKQYQKKMPEKQITCAHFWHIVYAHQQQRIVEYKKKIQRTCTEVQYERKKNQQYWYRREWESPFLMQFMSHPESTLRQAKTQLLKKGNTCTVFKLTTETGQEWVVKRYNPKGKGYELLHKGQISRAKRSWIYAHILHFMGISTPKPIALMEHTPQWGQQCNYFISSYIPGVSAWEYFCQEGISSEQQKIAEHFLLLFATLYQYKISHGDMKGSNFLCYQGDIYLLDLDAMQQHRLSRNLDKRWTKDTQRFLRNWQKKACYTPWLTFFSKHL